MAGLNYTPPKTVQAFMQDDSRIRVIVGPIGSGKSMGCIMELLRLACAQAPYEGVRYSRFACIRNTLQQLRQTVLSDIKNYLGGICSYYATDSTIQLRFNLADGTKVHSDLLLMPLDTPDDVKRLLSLQLTGAWINELREVPMDIVRPLLGRTGRYPSKVNGGATWRGIIADTNPWDTDSAYHERMVLKPHPRWKLFQQPSGVSPEAENVENLPADYYADLMDEHDSDFVNVHVYAEWGASNAGQAVFRRSFSPLTHARPFGQMITNPHRPLMVGMDFGRTPCALICQIDNAGRLIIYKEVVTDDMGLNQMLEEKLMPVLNGPEFKGRSIYVVADPAGNQRSQLNDENHFTVLKDHGFRAYEAATNDVEKRIQAVEKLLLRHIAGQPALQINRTECPTLVTALGSRYRYRKKRDGQLEDRPEKTHPWSDIADALEYAALGAQMNLLGRVMQPVRIPRPPPYSALAWT